MPANFSNGTSVYHGLTANLRKRFGNHYEFLASYTWSHAIDDSTDLQSPLSPQNNYNVAAERGNSLFDQRHRFVFSGVYQSGNVGSGFVHKLLSDWTLAPVIEVVSGRPFNIITGDDRNFDFGTTTDRPVISGPNGTTACGDKAASSRYSPTGFLIQARNPTICSPICGFRGESRLPSGSRWKALSMRSTSSIASMWPT